MVALNIKVEIINNKQNIIIEKDGIQKTIYTLENGSNRHFCGYVLDKNYIIIYHDRKDQEGYHYKDARFVYDINEDEEVSLAQGTYSKITNMYVKSKTFNIHTIMSYLLKESLLLEEALKRADSMINQWKDFYKYWINAPIPCYIVKYEELIDDPKNILKDLSRFMLGIKSIEETKLDYSIKRVLKMDIDNKYLAFDVSMKQSDNLSDNILTQFQDKFTKLNSLMKKFKYADDENDNNDIYELKEEESAANWINEFNNENLIKSVELQENIANSVLTSSYYTLRLS